MVKQRKGWELMVLISLNGTSYHKEGMDHEKWEFLEYNKVPKHSQAKSMEKEKTHKKNSGKKWPNMETCMNLPR